MLLAAGCSRDGEAVTSDVDLAHAVGAAAECRSFARDERREGHEPWRDPRETEFYLVAVDWFEAVAVDGGRDASPFSMRVEIVRRGPEVVAEATVDLGARTVTRPLTASRQVVGGVERTALWARFREDKDRFTAVGTVDESGRITLTACRELWSLPPLDPTGATPSPRRSAAAGERYFGGRTPTWWRARLAELRKDGPPELYSLAVLRARAAGLNVEEREGGLSVEPPPRGEFR